ncbi:hypothetical protein [Pseudidiomarina salinarum]|uniref:M61 family metallopeptidase n=1 Tax=Pseudidiomarina salinarum TaxID=435908 RepID=UPI00068CAEF0|nr:hypothetical protein [Pseudidiomarina salinarum]RUO69167.1 peptidase M61 [Pseudidiomarina salinarum]
MGRMISRGLCALALTYTVAAAAQTQPVAVTVSYAPVIGDDRVQALEVTLEVDGRHFAANETVFSLPQVITNVGSVAQTLGDLPAADADGPFTLKASLNPTENPTENQSTDQAIKQWQASRATTGPITVRYQAEVPEQAGALGVAPPIELRATGESVSAGTGIVVLEPAIEGELQYRVRWPRAATTGKNNKTGVSTLGVGDTGFQTFSSPAEFSATYFMYGDIGHYSSERGEFVTAWQGQPPFDALELMQWAEQLYAYYNDFFEVDEAAQYVVFMRSNDINPGGGMARGSSFILTYDEHTDAEKLKGTLSHEMFHTFLGGLAKPGGLESSWFSEGLAVYYQWLIPLQGGMASDEQYLSSFNSTAVRYYTNIMNDTPNSEVPEGFWLDTRIRVLPYDRGSLYFAALNHRLQQASDGELSLNDLLVYLREQEQAGELLTEDLWLQALEKFAGVAEVTRFQQVQQGALVELPDAALGPRFERYTDTFRRYELGFAPAALTEQPRRVRGLIEGSNAAKAGLKEGDIIVDPVPQDSIQGNQQATLTLKIQRGDEIFDVTYLPRGEQVRAPQWRLKDDE